MANYPTPMSPKDDNLDAALKTAVGKNPITDSIVDDDVENERYGVFCAIRDLVNAAEDLYCEGELEFDKVITSLSEAIGKLEGEEETLKEAWNKDQEEEKAEGPND